MFKKPSVVVGLVLALLVIFAIPALANILTSATATADCNGFNLTLSASDLSSGTMYTIDYTLTLTCGGSVTVVTGNKTFTATSSTAMVTAAGTWPGAPLTTNCTVSLGSATLTSSGSTVTITFNGSTMDSLSCPSIDERMTGGGSVLITMGTVTSTSTGSSTSNMQVDVNGGTDSLTKVTHGYEIHCGNPPETPNNLEVNWPGHHFHMDSLTVGNCICNSKLLPPENPDAGFNEFIGLGTGKLDGVEGATISFDFTDQGEPGTNDTEAIMIFPPGSTTPVLNFSTTPLEPGGNQQAHREGGPKVPPCNP